MTEKKSLAQLCKEIEIWDDWQIHYKHFVPLFVKEAVSKTRWEDWDRDVFWEFFERPNEQCVSSLQQGYFSNADKERIKSNWDKLAPLLKTIAEHQNEPQWDAYEAVRNLLKSLTSRNMRAATNRLIAGLQPRLLCTIVDNNKLWELFCKLKDFTTDEIPRFEGGNWFRNSFNLFALFKKVLQPEDATDIVTYPWQMLCYLKSLREKQMNMDQYISEKVGLLEKVRNLIFTGAPGTGKTYLAKQIAMQMIGVAKDEELEKSGQFAFVQFHPSYDYTDFVEGLRPVKTDENGNIGFELKDGTFKEFCKRAEEKNSLASLDAAIELFKKKCSETAVKVKNKSDYEFSVTYRGGRTFRVRSDKSEAEEGRDFPANIDSVKKLYQGQEDGIYNMTYVWGILDHLKKKYGIPEYKEDTSDKKYVFVIDEINRGEISKIFGELFFSIDPSYRGKKGAVETQYANLHETGEKFYVPDNVYIIGTMNDIDRSVESFDFAMRRRFTWLEITAEESAKNMGLTEETRTRMKRLNEKISDIEGLNASYHIGGAYFLSQEGTVEPDYGAIWKLRIEPLLKEYLRGMPDAEQKLADLKVAYEAGDNGQ